MAKTTNTTLKLFITSKKVNAGKTTFRAYKTKMKLSTKNEDGERIEKTYSVDVKFFNDKTREFLKAHDVKRGIITCKATDVNAPFAWKVEKDENGKDVYPCVKVYGIEDYKDVPFVREQSAFVLGDEDEEITDDDSEI